MGNTFSQFISKKKHDKLVEDLCDDFVAKEMKSRRDIKLLEDDIESRCQELSRLNASLVNANVRIGDLETQNTVLETNISNMRCLFEKDARHDLVKSLLDSSINNGWMSDDMEAGIYHKMLDLIVEKIDTKLI